MQLPSVSTAGSRRTIVRRFAIRRTLIASATVRTIARASGIAETASATTARNSSLRSSPASAPSPKRTTRSRAPPHGAPRCEIRAWTGVSTSRSRPGSRDRAELRRDAGGDDDPGAAAEGHRRPCVEDVRALDHRRVRRQRRDHLGDGHRLAGQMRLVDLEARAGEQPKSAGTRSRPRRRPRRRGRARPRRSRSRGPRAGPSRRRWRAGAGRPPSVRRGTPERSRRARYHQDGTDHRGVEVLGEDDGHHPGEEQDVDERAAELPPAIVRPRSAAPRAARAARPSRAAARPPARRFRRAGAQRREDPVGAQRPRRCRAPRLDSGVHRPGGGEVRRRGCRRGR